MAAVAAWGDLPVEGPTGVPTWVVHGGLVSLSVAFCVYAIEKELLLRRLTRHLVSERVLVTALENRLEELATLLDAGRAMNAVLDLPEVLRRILDNALDLLSASDGSVFLVDEPGVLLGEVMEIAAQRVNGEGREREVDRGEDDHRAGGGAAAEQLGGNR